MDFPNTGYIEHAPCLPDVGYIGQPLEVHRYGVKVDKEAAEQQDRDGCYRTQKHRHLQSQYIQCVILYKTYYIALHWAICCCYTKILYKMYYIVLHWAIYCCNTKIPMLNQVFC